MQLCVHCITCIAKTVTLQRSSFGYAPIVRVFSTDICIPISVPLCMKERDGERKIGREMKIGTPGNMLFLTELVDLLVLLDRIFLALDLLALL